MYLENFERSFRNGYRNTVTAAAYLFTAIYLLALLLVWFFSATGIIVALWDALVWLIRADWRTTSFDYPIIALIVVIVAACISAVAEALSNGCNDLIDGIPDEKEDVHNP